MKYDQRWSTVFDYEWCWVFISLITQLILEIIQVITMLVVLIGSNNLLHLQYHRLTTTNGVHQFRYFLLLMNISFCLLMHKMYNMYLHNLNAYKHVQTTTGIYEEEVPILVYTLCWCKPCIYFLCHDDQQSALRWHLWGSRSMHYSHLDDSCHVRL